MNNSIDNTMLSIGESAKLLGVHPETLRNWHKLGLLQPYVTLGGHRRYSKSEIEKLLQKKITLFALAQFNIKECINKVSLLKEK